MQSTGYSLRSTNMSNLLVSRPNSNLMEEHWIIQVLFYARPYLKA